MQHNPLVSVIIPAYNAAEYIEEAIKSILNQTWGNLEIIIINDGSKDETEKISNTFLSDNRIKYVSQKNQGSSSARNSGLEIATGDFIQYLDADDSLSKDKIEKQVNILINQPVYDIAVCSTNIFYKIPGDTGEEIDTSYLYNTNNTFDFALNLYGLNGRSGMIQPNAFLISRKLADKIGPWNLNISLDDDGEYFCRAILQSTAIHFTEGLNYYRKPIFNKESLSNQHSFSHAKGALNSLILKTNHLLEIENSERVKNTMAVHFAAFIYMYDAKFKDLSKQAEEYIYQMGLKKIPNAGGNNFKKIASLVGFKPALKIKKLFGS